MMKRLFVFSLLLLILPLWLEASFLHMPDDVGISPVSLASQQVFSPYFETGMAPYYNPAFLANTGEISLTLSYVFYLPSLSATNFEIDEGNVNYTTIGFILPLSRVIRVKNGITLGVVTGSDGFFTTSFQYHDSRSDTPQFFRYRYPQMLITPALGIPIYRDRVRVGIGLNMYVYSNNRMDVNVPIVGDGAEGVRAEFTSKMKNAVIFGGNINIGNWKVDFVYRDGYGYPIDVVSVSYVYAGDEVFMTRTVNLNFFDSYVPTTLEGRGVYRWKRFLFGVRLRYKKWSQLTDILNESDVVRGNKGLEFGDRLSVAGGLSFAGEGRNKLRAFFSMGYDPSPLISTESPEVNFVDANRYILGVGIVLSYDNRVFYNPLRVGVAYNLAMLERRNFKIVDEEGNETETTISGYTNAFSLNVSVLF